MLVRNTPKNFIYIFIVLCCFSGVLGVLSFQLQLPILKLWKEFFIFILFFLVLFLKFPQIYKRTLWSISSLIIYLVFFTLYSTHKGIALFSVFYQYKIDLPILLFISIIIDTCLFLKNDALINFNTKISKLIICLGVFNAIAIFFERFFPERFANLIDFNLGDWGSDVGVKIISAGQNIRAIGFLTTFVPAGTLMLMCLIILIENKKIVKFNKFMYLFLIFLFIISIYFSTYKTAFIGLLFYFTIKIIDLVFKRYSDFMIYMFSSFIFLIFFISTHFMFVYNIVQKFSYNIAYNSIYLRAFYNWKVIDEINSPTEFLFGLGLGKNGIFGQDSISNINEPIPLDSSYIYLVSNYGYISVIIFIIFVSAIVLYLSKYKQHDIFGARYLLLYTICVEFFYNNLFANFPTNVFLIILTVIPVIKIYRNKSKKLS